MASVLILGALAYFILQPNFAQTNKLKGGELTKNLTEESSEGANLNKTDTTNGNSSLKFSYKPKK